MTTQQVELVRKSWDIISRINMQTVGSLFYHRLFEIAPDTTPLFSNIPIPEQSKKLISMLSFILSKLDTLEEVLPDIVSMAQKHVGYGVKEQHYTAVGNALLWTLEKGMGPYWNNALKDAWVVVYNTLSFTMIAAASSPALLLPEKGASVPL